MSPKKGKEFLPKKFPSGYLIVASMSVSRVTSEIEGFFFNVY